MISIVMIDIGSVYGGFISMYEFFRKQIKMRLFLLVVVVFCVIIFWADI